MEVKCFHVGEVTVLYKTLQNGDVMWTATHSNNTALRSAQLSQASTQDLNQHHRVSPSLAQVQEIMIRAIASTTKRKRSRSTFGDVEERELSGEKDQYHLGIDDLKELAEIDRDTFTTHLRDRVWEGDLQLSGLTQNLPTNFGRGLIVPGNLILCNNAKLKKLGDGFGNGLEVGRDLILSNNANLEELGDGFGNDLKVREDLILSNNEKLKKLGDGFGNGLEVGRDLILSNNANLEELGDGFGRGLTVRGKLILSENLKSLENLSHIADIAEVDFCSP